MAQCICGQYVQPGDVQCRYCGRPLEVYSSAAASYDVYNAAPYDNYTTEAPYDPNFAFKGAQQQQPLQPPKTPQYPAAPGYQGAPETQNRMNAAPMNAAQAHMPRPEAKPVRLPMAADAELRQFMGEVRASIAGMKRNITIIMIVLIVFAAIIIGASLFGLNYFIVFLNALQESFV